MRIVDHCGMKALLDLINRPQQFNLMTGKR